LLVARKKEKCRVQKKAAARESRCRIARLRIQLDYSPIAAEVTAGSRIRKMEVRYDSD